MSKLSFAVLFAILWALPALAENEAKPIQTSTAVTYELRNLKPAGITQYSSAGDVVRQYFDYQNEQGSHHVIYEEVPALSPARTVLSVRQMASAFDSLCAMDIECSSKAFCTGDCKHMYYEVSNAPGDPFSPDRNKCKVLFFSCEKAPSPAARVAAPAPGG